MYCYYIIIYGNAEVPREDSYKDTLRLTVTYCLLFGHTMTNIYNFNKL